jgi:hypothetical protein
LCVDGGDVGVDSKTHAFPFVSTVGARMPGSDG